MMRLISKSVQDTVLGITYLLGNDKTIMELKERRSKRRLIAWHPQLKKVQKPVKAS